MSHYKLYISLRSPFARRCRIVLDELKLSHEVFVLDVFQNNPGYENLNPLKRVPTMVHPNGETISDSNQILFQLEKENCNHSLYQSPGVNPVRIRKISALATGVMEYTVAYFLEGLRPAASQSSEWFDEYRTGIVSTLDYFENELRNSKGKYLYGDSFGIWDIDVGVAYGYFRFRSTWRGFKAYPRLEQYYSELLKRDSFSKTEPKI